MFFKKISTDSHVRWRINFQVYPIILQFLSGLFLVLPPWLFFRGAPTTPLSPPELPPSWSSWLGPLATFSTGRPFPTWALEWVLSPRPLVLLCFALHHCFTGAHPPINPEKVHMESEMSGSLHIWKSLYSAFSISAVVWVWKYRVNTSLRISKMLLQSMSELFWRSLLCSAW